MNLRILIFSTAYFPSVGGAEIAVREITDRLPQKECILITARLCRAPRVERVGRVLVYRLGIGHHIDKWLLPFLGIWKALQLHRREAFDCLWSIMASQASIAAALFKKFFPQVPLVLTLQEGDEEEHLQRYVGGSATLSRLLIFPWHRLVFRCADKTTAISRHLINRAKRMGVSGRVALIPNGVDLSRFVATDSSVRAQARHSVRTEYQIPETATLVVTCSRLVKKNGVLDLIDAFTLLPPSTFLLIAGTGELLATAQERARLLGINKRVIFAGYVPHEYLPHLLWASDVFCRPSLSEGLGNVFLEAMAAGVITIGTPVGGIPDIITDGETGFFCQPGNKEDIAACIQRSIACNEKEKEHIRYTALQRVVTNYSWDQIAKDMDNLFIEVCTS